MSDWLDDLYESGTYNLDIAEIKDKIIEFSIMEFDVYRKSKVRLRWIIENKLKIEEYIYSSDLLEVYYALLETGDYDGRLIKYKGVSDILIWRKPWHERNRILFGFILSTVGYIATLTIAFIVGLIAGQSCSQ